MSLQSEVSEMKLMGESLPMVENLILLKPLVERLGMQWEAQRLALHATRFAPNLQRVGGVQALALPLVKAFGWLHTLNSKLIKDPEVRENFNALLDSWDEALYRYETQGAAINPNKFSSEQVQYLEKQVKDLSQLRKPAILGQIPIINDIQCRVELIDDKPRLMILLNDLNFVFRDTHKRALKPLAGPYAPFFHFHAIMMTKMLRKKATDSERIAYEEFSQPFKLAQAEITHKWAMEP